MILAIVGYVVLLSLYKITPYEYNNIIQVHCECANVTPEEASAVEDYQCSICKEKEKLEMMNDGIADTREYVVCVRGVRARSARISIILLSLVICLENIRRNHKKITLTSMLEYTLEYLRESLTRTQLEHKTPTQVHCREEIHTISSRWSRVRTVVFVFKFGIFLCGIFSGFFQRFLSSTILGE